MTAELHRITEAFERALGDILARVCFSGVQNADLRVAIAYSGGLDSTVLLNLAASYAADHGLPLHAFHVHHGLSVNADAWLTHCRSECMRLGIDFSAERVVIEPAAEGGVEEKARLVRYAALGEMCRRHQAGVLLTAHHQDDQSETVLLNLFRGTGLAGLAGMETCNRAPGLLGEGEILVGRPLLGVSRAELEGVAAACGLAYVEDESNVDPRYARNALRHRVMPAIEEFFPGFRERVARAASHARAAQGLLMQSAEADLAICSDGEALDAAKLRLLDDIRVDNLLRLWFKDNGCRMPSTARLEEIRRQLLGASWDAQIRIEHAGYEVRRYRDRIHLVRRAERAEQEQICRDFHWNGEPRLRFEEFGGALHFDEAEIGLEEEWLKRQLLTIRLRQPGDRVKPAANRPTRDLKHHYQALDVPPWMRARLPQICAGERLLFSAGIGMNWRYLPEECGRRIRLSWQFE